MRATTAELLELLQEAAPGRHFNVQSASSPTEDDGIQLTENHWLFIDGHDDRDDPPMVRLTDENRETGGQLAFWVIRRQSILPDVVLYALAQ